MRIAIEAREIVTKALDEVHDFGMKLSTEDTFHCNEAAALLIQRLDAAGFVIVRKPSVQTDVLIKIRTPEGSPVSGYVFIHEEVDEAQAGQASQDDLSILAAARSATFASRDGFRLGAVVELPKGFAVIGVDSQPSVDSIKHAVADCFKASRLTYAAAQVIGHDAASEILAARRRGDPRAAGLPPGSPSSITPAKRQAILDGWASGLTAPQLATTHGTNAGIVRNLVGAARRRGDPRAAHRNPGSAWRPEPVRYASSDALLEALLKQARERAAEWERSEMGQRMRAIAVSPDEG